MKILPGFLMNEEITLPNAVFSLSILRLQSNSNITCAEIVSIRDNLDQVRESPTR
jgi:hypothetical protein